MAQLDRRAGRGRRSAMIVEFLRRGLEDEQQWDDVIAAFGARPSGWRRASGRGTPLGVAEGERAGHWRRDLAADGVTVHQADCLIAAAAVTVGARLAAGTPADSPMEDVTVEHWPVGA